jgi:predicted lipoprotein
MSDYNSYQEFQNRMDYAQMRQTMENHAPQIADASRKVASQIENSGNAGGLVKLALGAVAFIAFAVTGEDLDCW